MRKAAVLLSLLVGISFLFVPLGCKKEQPSPTPQITAAPTGAPTPARTAAPAPTPPRPAPVATPATSPPATPTPALIAPLTLTIDSPAAESVVKDRTVTVRGRSSPDAVVTAGNSNIEVDENGNFTTTVTLAQGINIIEVLASDLTGTTKGQVLTVIYAP